MKIKSVLSLSGKSKKSFYKSFIFYNTFRSSQVNQVKFLSFKNLLLKQVHNNEEDFNQELLVRVQVVYKNNFFLYLNAGKKCTLSTPKTKYGYLAFLKESLGLLRNLVLKDLTLSKSQFLLQNFQTKMINSMVLTPFKLQSGLQEYFIFRKLIDFPSVRYYKFLFFRNSLHFFSVFQKKINFYQFNILFKKA
jgi:hypothetical protein